MPRESSGGWTTVIRPRKGWLDLHLGELVHYRDLILLLVKRDFTVMYKQTVLGPAWAIIQPLLTTIIFTVGSVVAMFCGCGGRTVMGTQPAYRQP